MKEISKMSVFIGEAHVGTLALTRDNLVAFQYSPSWLDGGFSISPLSLPLSSEVFLPRSRVFDGLFGVFDDSLPDGWGRLLLDRTLRKRGENSLDYNPLMRLALVGDNASGLLSYVPDHGEQELADFFDLDTYAEESLKVFNDEDSDFLDSLYRAGGSSGGARPKALLLIEEEQWLVKFPASLDNKDVGVMEYSYNVCAEKCSIDTAHFRLLPSKKGPGYFASKRFDRRYDGNGHPKRIHMVSACGLLESSHRIPALDYNDLMKLTMVLTRDIRCAEEMYRRMCFNVFAHNRDDHSKNFAFLYLEEESRWVLSPAYDLTYSSSMNGEHATSVNGNGKNPDINDILAVADNIELDKKFATDTAKEIEEIVTSELSEYL